MRRVCVDGPKNTTLNTSVERVYTRENLWLAKV